VTLVVTFLIGIIGYALKEEVKTWLRKVGKRKLQVGKSIDN
jgi:hypothetical protein